MIITFKNAFSMIRHRRSEPRFAVRMPTPNDAATYDPGRVRVGAALRKNLG